MRLTYTVAVVALLGCGGGDFRSEGPGPDGGPGVGAGGGASSSADVSSSSAGEGAGGSGAAGGDGGGGSAQSSASTGSAGSAGEGGGPCVPSTCADLGKDCGPSDDGCGGPLDCGSCPVNETCGGDGTPGVCGGCVPKTCAGEAVNCGLLDDGCGNTLNCGDYALSSTCTYPSASGCVCPWDYPKAFHCPGTSLENSPPPDGKGDCVVNPYGTPQNDANWWCCQTL